MEITKLSKKLGCLCTDPINKNLQNIQIYPMMFILNYFKPLSKFLYTVYLGAAKAEQLQITVQAV